MNRLVLAGDLGGSKATLGLFSVEGGRLRAVRQTTLPSGKHPDAAELVRTFWAGSPAVAAACFGVAGPVRSGRAEPPNLPWPVDAGQLAAGLGLERVSLVNDLVAMARGIHELPPGEIAVLQRGRADPDGNRALIAAGTGLGEVVLVRCEHRWQPVPSEGGHASFAPAGPLQRELLGFLAEEHGAVSAERVVSGPGLLAVYRFLVATGRARETPRVRDRMAAEDPPAVISDEALLGTDEACARALDLWVRAYGAEAGNLALRALATAGLYVGGGIAPKVLPWLRDGGFLEAFRAKGRMAGLLARIPVRVILDPNAPLYGAARHAADGLA